MARARYGTPNPDSTGRCVRCMAALELPREPVVAPRSAGVSGGGLPAELCAGMDPHSPHS